MDFPTCQLYFQKLVAEYALPPKMEIKLKCIQATVTQMIDAECFKQLPEFERESLKDMNIQTQKAIFVDIINCFIVSETRQHFKNIKTKIKKVSSNQEYVQMYLTCIGNRLSFFNKKEGSDLWKELKLENIQISSLYQKSKKKYTFSLTSENNKYELRFQEERTCASIHGQLLNLIKQFKSPQERRRYQKNEQSNIGQQDIVVSPFDAQAFYVEQERNYLKSLKKMIQKYTKEAQGSFKLLRNINNGKMEVSNSGKVRLLLFVQKCEITRYIQSFILLDCWNTQIQTFRILKLIRPNTYLAYILLKKQNMWTAQRQAYVTISYLKHCKCLEEADSQQTINGYKFAAKHYIIINSLDYEQTTASARRMDFNQIVEFSEIQYKKDSIFLSLTSNVDAKTYQVLASRVDLNVNLLKDVPSLSILYRQKAIQKVDLKLFDFKRCACNIQPAKSHLFKEQKEQTEKSIRSVSKMSIPVNNVEAAEGQAQLWSTEEVLKIIEEEANYMKNQKILKIIRQKIHQRYYLRQRFDQSINLQPYIQSKFTLNHNTEFLLQNGRWKFNSKEEYIFIDEEQMKVQKGMMKLLIKQITANIMAGKSIMNMSLPVQIFGRESLIEGVARCFGFVPRYMHQAVQADDVIQQMKNIACAFIFIFACQPRLGKPFNPILGETFQGIIGGIPVYVEQISHHPPISAFYMRTDTFQAYGNFDMHVDMGLNAAFSKNHGLYHIHIFKTSTRFVIRFPDVEVGGIMMGDRTFGLSGKGFILEKSTCTYLEYSVGKQKKKLYECQNKLRACELIGGIFKVMPQFALKALAYDIKKNFQGAKPEDVIEKHCQMNGKWFGDLFFDGVEYKSLKNGPYPIICQRQKVLLPSDCLFRQDIVYKRWGDNKRSNEQKQILENLQRRDRKLRSHK